MPNMPVQGVCKQDVVLPGGCEVCADIFDHPVIIRGTGELGVLLCRADFLDVMVVVVVVCGLSAQSQSQTGELSL